MRDLGKLSKAFIPEHEKAYESVLLVDSAIRNQVEYTLETVARALCGRHKIRYKYADKDDMFTHTEHIEGDCGSWIKKTSKNKIKARMQSFVFYGNDRVQILIKIIDFWAGRKVIFPCGGANSIKAEGDGKGTE